MQTAQKTLAAQEAALTSAELAFANTELRFEAGAVSALNTQTQGTNGQRKD